jgi:hypothetical protein
VTSDFGQSEWTFTRVVGGYETRCADLGITITAEEIKRKSDEMTSLLCVRSTMVGLRTVEDDILKTGMLNFYAPRSRSEWVKSLQLRCPGEAAGLDWDTFLERFVNQVIAAERTGEPAVELSEVELIDRDQYLVPDLISAEDPTIWFGDGGSMKSYLALAACATISSGSPQYLGVAPTVRTNVGYVDWEFNPQAHRRRLGRLAMGEKMPRVTYIRCDRPLTYEVNRLQRLVRDHRLGFLVLDSIVVSCDGPAENSDTVGRYLQAVRQLGVPTLLIAHVTKSDDGDKKPLGSVMWHNAARLTWFFKKSGEVGDQVTVGLFNRKNSENRIHDPMAFSFLFDRMMGQTVISPVGVAEMAQDEVLAERLPVKARIAAAIESGPLTISQIAVEVGKSIQDVATVVRRGEAKGMFVRVMGADSVYRIALPPESVDGRQVDN